MQHFEVIVINTATQERMARGVLKASTARVAVDRVLQRAGSRRSRNTGELYYADPAMAVDDRITIQVRRIA